MNYTIDKFEPQQGLVFHDLKPGDVFTIVGDKQLDLYIKLTTYVQPDNTNIFTSYNAITLSGGDLAKVSTEAPVRKLITKMHFTNEDFTQHYTYKGDTNEV